MTNSKFDITLNTWDHEQKISGRFIFSVELTYKSEKIQRYKLRGGEKEMTLERNLSIKNTYFKNWKILDLNFTMQIVNEATTITLHNIYKKIEEQMEGVKSIAWQRQEY